MDQEDMVMVDINIFKAYNTYSKKLIKNYKLNNKSKILDVGCGKGYLLYEIKNYYQKLK